MHCLKGSEISMLWVSLHVLSFTSSMWMCPMDVFSCQGLGRKESGKMTILVLRPHGLIEQERVFVVVYD